MAAIIRTIINGFPATEIFGASRDDLRPGDIVTANSVDVHTTYSWVLDFIPEDPDGVPSSAVLSSDINPTTQFTVDNEGAYLLRLTVDASLGTEDVQSVRLRFLTTFGKLRLVAGGERRGSGGVVPVDVSADGWAHEQNRNLQTLRGFVASVSSSGRVFYVDANRGQDSANSQNDPTIAEGYADFFSVQTAINAAAAHAVPPSETDPFVIMIRPGLYVEDLLLSSYIHLIGMPESSEIENDRRVVIQAANSGGNAHVANLLGVGAFSIIAGVVLENAAAGITEPVLKKTGVGQLVLKRSWVTQQGNDASMGPALSLEAGNLQVDNCLIHSEALAGPNRLAFSQEGLNTEALFTQSIIRGPSGCSVNQGFTAGTRAVFRRCEIESNAPDASAFALRSSAEFTFVERSDLIVDALSVLALQIHPAGSAVAHAVSADVRWSRVGGTLSFNTTGIVGNTALNLGSVEYPVLTVTGALTAGEPTALVQSTTLFYDNTASGMTANNVQDAIDELMSGGAALQIEDEGSPLGAFTTLNFIGTDVTALSGGGGTANIYIPPPAFDSHWNTADGSNGDQSTTESAVRVTAHISTPSGGEGTPFNTNGWATTDQAASTNTLVTFTTPSTTTGFGGDSTVTVNVYDADGTTVLDTVTTAALVADGPYGTATIAVNLTGFASDITRFKAKLTVVVDIVTVLSNAGLTGGRYHVSITHTTDSSSDGTGPYAYTQTDLFLDTNPSTPAINGTVTIAETGGGVSTKHLSGVEYYILGSQFTADVTDIDQLNRNTSRVSDNLSADGTEYGLPTLAHSPFGTGSANFTGWTNVENQDNVTYQITTWAITSASFRYIGPTGNVSAFPRDPWSSGATVPSSDDAILVDTFGTTSLDLVEDFDDENRRQDSGYNGGTTPGNWTSTATLGASEAQVFNSNLLVPSSTTFIRSDGPNSANADWSTFDPITGGANPNYTALVAPVQYYRTIVDSVGSNRASFTMVLTGTFLVDAVTDLANDDLQIFIRRRASAGGGDFGPSANPLLLHNAVYNFATWDDGVTDGHIREASSSGGTVNATFGGKSCEDGFFMEIRINDAGIQIDRLEVTFF